MSTLNSDRGFFRFNALVDEKYTPEQMISELGLDRAKKICDGYGHVTNCQHFVQELKSKNIKRGVEQLLSTVEQLENKGKKVDKIFLIINKLGKSELKKFKYDRRYGLLYLKNARNPIQVRGKPIRIIRKEELSEEFARWQFT
ncbi:MAG: hypothetical protein IB616_00930 [Methanosarcinales archaeon]|nr:MAG: hypothetical protein IB616_00930 [Methanosarcinales archaeon]